MHCKKIYYFSKRDASLKTNSGGHVVYVVNSFNPDISESIIYTRDQQHEHQQIAFKSFANGSTIVHYSKFILFFVEKGHWTNRDIRLDLLQYLKCKRTKRPSQANLPNLPKYKY